MNATELKQWIYENNKIEELLEEIGCHDIKFHSSGYFTAANKDGDNKQAITIYIPDLGVVNYTRSLPTPSDIITLVQFNKELNFFHAFKYICNFFGLDYYSEPNQNKPKSLQILEMMKTMRGIKQEEEDNTPIKILPDEIKKYYPIIVNDMFLKDGIDYVTQIEFELSYENESNRIVFPIYSEFNDLVSYKGRLFKDEILEDELKYIYLYKCPRNKILFGLNKTHDYIRQEGKVWVGEAEKFTMQLWSYGYRNCISLGGKKISKTQIEKLTRLGVDIVLALDKDVTQKELEDIAGQFIDGVNVWAIIDDKNILKDKESPSDNVNNWKYLIENCIYKLK